jgi:hypothetical protein
MKSHATRKPVHGPSERAAYLYIPPADEKRLASWPIAVAAQTHAISASPTESGSACREYGTEMKIEIVTLGPIFADRAWSAQSQGGGLCVQRPPSIVATT